MKKIAVVLLSMAASAAIAEVKVKDAWIRPSTGPNGALFMMIENDSADMDKLKSAKTSDERCDHMELHAHVHEDGVMKMREVEAIEVPANGTAELKPGGLHIMFMTLKEPLEEGKMVPVSLTFENSGLMELEVPVRKPQ